MKYIVRLRTAVLFLMIFLKGYSQQTSNNKNVWLHYSGKNKFSEKLSFTLEATMRYADGFSQKQQWFVRPSLDYQFTKRINASIGYTHYDTYVYGEIPMNKITTPEEHVWLQGMFVYTTDNFKFTHRLRDENRWVGLATNDANGNYVIDDYAYRNRLRYMYLINYSITKKDNTSKLFASLGDEVFMNIGVKEAKTFVQQNRVIAGFGYNINANHQIQINYIHQNIWNLKNTLVEDNPTLRISYITNFDWYKKSE